MLLGADAIGAAGFDVASVLLMPAAVGTESGVLV